MPWRGDLIKTSSYKVILATVLLTAFAGPRRSKGGLAQLARALALQARGHRFESDILHRKEFANLQIENSKIFKYFDDGIGLLVRNHIISFINGRVLIGTFAC